MKLLRFITGLFVSVSVCGLMSCADGYESPNGFDVGVNDQNLETPSKLTFQVNAEGTEATITWPLVMGALGYQVTMADVTNPDSMKIVDKYDNYLVDGCSMTVAVTEDSKYSFSMQVIGDTERGNKDGEKLDTMFATMVPSIATIPNGADIYEFMQQNPIDTMNWGKEIAVELEPGANYTMSGPVDFQGFNMTVRGNKSKPAIVELTTDSAAFYTYTGFKLKYIRFDMTNSNTKGLVCMSNKNLPDSIKSDNHPEFLRSGAQIKGIYNIFDPVYISDCWVKNLHRSLVHDNNVSCAWWTLIINNCIIQVANEKGGGGTGLIAFDNTGKLIKNVSITKSTIYNIYDNSSAYFLRFSHQSNAMPEKVYGNVSSYYASWDFVLQNCTLSKMYTGQKWVNNVNGQGFTCLIDHNILYDLFQPSRRISEKGGTMTYRFNYAWRTDENADGVGAGYKDAYGTPFASAEENCLEGVNLTKELDLNDDNNGGINFKPSIYEAVANGCGDPRWLK
ncbi:MAG: DUF4992 family lipoprotein [Prevotellaceae bacterium]|nr:DUF4992 family lipoprotein [Prevotellaceae bacterium]